MPARCEGSGASQTSRQSFPDSTPKPDARVLIGVGVGGTRFYGYIQQGTLPMRRRDEGERKYAMEMSLSTGSALGTIC